MSVIAGTAKDYAGNFVCRLIRVYRKDTGDLVGETVSNPTTGVWSVTVPTTATKYFALQHDGDADPYWDGVRALIHFDNDTGIVDARGRPISVSSVSLSSAQSVFGGYSGRFTGGAGITYAQSTDFDITGDCTIDLGAYFDDGSSRYLLSTGAAGTNDSYLLRAQVGVDTRFDIRDSGGSYTTVFGPAPIGGAFNRFRIVLSGNDYRLYTNGVGGAVVTTTSRPWASVTPLYLGRSWYNGSGALEGYEDEFRFTQGVARSTGASYTLDGAQFYDARNVGAENALIFDNLTAV